MLVTQIKHCRNFISGGIKYLFKAHICCVFLMFYLPSHAQFINTLTDGKQKVWVDPSSKEGTGNVRIIMELVNYKDKQMPKQGLEYSSIIYQYQFDCNKKVFKVLMSVAFEKHNGQGRVIFRDDTATPTYVSIRDGSSVFEAHELACK